MGHERARASHGVVIEPTLDGWRDVARVLLRREVPPEAVTWREVGEAQLEAGLFEERPDAPAPDIAPDIAPEPSRHRVPRRFMELATTAACFDDARRWPLLYRVLWRLTHGEPRLLDVAVDDDVHRLLRMDKAVRRDVHKLHAFVRFRRVAGDPDAARDAREHYVAWFAPSHDCLALAAPFFARRFPNMRWSILGPRRSAYWDTHALRLGPGVPRDTAPAGDALETLWRSYYASIFNPARVRTRAMQAEMPKKVGSSRVDLQACKLEYSIVSPK